MILIVVVLRTKPSGLYRHWRGLGLHRVGLQRRRSTSGLPSLPSTPRRVPSGHGMKSSILYLHSPTVQPKYIVRLSGYPLIQDSLTRRWGLHRLRKRLNLRRTQASSAHPPSSSIRCTSSARCCGMRGHDTPCLRSSCSRYWWPRVSYGTTFKVTPSRSSRPTHWKGYSGAPSPLEGSPNETSSCRRFSWSSAQPGSSREPHLLISWLNGRKR